MLTRVLEHALGREGHIPDGIAGELYSQSFYAELARVLQRGALLFHYTGAPNSLSSGRDLADEVSKRLRIAGFAAQPSGDGVLATKK